MKFTTHLITAFAFLLAVACAPALTQKEERMEEPAPAPVQEPEPAAMEAEPEFPKLVSLAPIIAGETMIDIATEECRGQHWKVTVPMIQEASGLEDVNKIYIGQVLKVWRDREGRCVANPAALQ
ncbi:MAG: LysM peptidoglycan-binding domain-containing protein [Gammaproteobacteria bacterium]|nr:LysM peptidoglycan-binding domain-containing protein [Gammaproteobacteria bacterium]MDD9800584.1 LysM peptidoglycan-binding domain-containing protein [Gammaproteobacteria bacterium]MDD9815706.1 LysM peptidoglycan-binding domain-containing protein [Gammaproteobacteria bacterium]MDD9850961.1 LysM peptidoglycan-binding domain-containing protein [Gammaproteobacteria bacterium]MDD9869945.1 LysM peptidoglycan-binding domain-containing protein [Gammaproteobacteria bacterium]